MKLKDENVSKKSRKCSISIVLYIVASIIALAGVALLVDNIFIFRKAVNEYVTQGYAIDVVYKQLIPSQLLPGIFEPIAVYGGIAFILIGISKLNKKISKYLVLLTEINVCNDTSKENISE
jgi:hypothetical protein